MVVSRRGFIRQGSLLLLAGGVSLGSADRVFGFTPSADTPPFNYAKATFLPHLNTIFRITYPNLSKTITTTLIEISDIGPVPDKSETGRECFVLKFRGTEGISQNTYLIDHAVLGQFKLFLVPAGKNNKGTYCQAVINRLNA